MKDKPTFIMLCGLPGSGKSTLAHELASNYVCPIYSSDSIRKKLTGSEENQDRDSEVFKILHDRIKEFLVRDEKSKVCIYDACNISYKKRMAFLNEIKKIDCYKICYWVYTPYDTCLKNNQNRDRKVPEYAIEHMYKNFYPPQYYEGWDKIIIHSKQAEIKDNLTDLFYGNDGLCKNEHDNPHHSLSIGNHCIACYLNVLDSNIADHNLWIAALLHDIGKAFTKGYKDSKGNPCETAHYYQHHLVSAYDAVPYLDNFNFVDKLEILALITWHMFPYFWEKENNVKMQNKYKRLWGENLYQKIMLLHKADQEAH